MLDAHLVASAALNSALAYDGRTDWPNFWALLKLVPREESGQTAIPIMLDADLYAHRVRMLVMERLPFDAEERGGLRAKLETELERLPWSVVTAVAAHCLGQSSTSIPTAFFS